ncbi:MAG: zinc ribbon domain-containing protein [Firmicutes bacterium]|nr:zinc ribbon domain-containing protein [[Eubacterium] siraeum]MCM1488626.1 zinc ribbon domain-containing protein [Bacillota bacterium]
MKCNNCHYELNDTDKFCGLCGTPNPNYAPEESPPAVNSAQSGGDPSDLRRENTEAAQAAPGSEPKEKRTVPLWLCIICIVIIFILSIACGALAQLHFGREALTELFGRITLW